MWFTAKNETGKTTINQLVRGVLFGWLAARGNTNSYKPEALSAQEVSFLQQLPLCLRLRSYLRLRSEALLCLKACLQSKAHPKLLKSNVLRGWHQSLYLRLQAWWVILIKLPLILCLLLQAMKLLGLDRHTEVTARLLTAGSGTQASPAHALATIDARIKDLMSKSAQFPDSIPNLRACKQELHDELSELGRQADALRVEKRRLDSFAERKTTLAAKQQELDADIEELRARLAQLESLHVRVDAAQARVNQLEHALADAQTTQASYHAACAHHAACANHTSRTNCASRRR